MQKIIFTTYSLSIGGAERHCVTIANDLVKHGAQVQIVLVDSPCVRFEVDPRVQIVYLKQDDKTFDISDNTAPVEIFECAPPKKLGLAGKVKLRLLKSVNKRRYLAEEQLLYFEQTYISRLRQYLKKFPDWTIVSLMTFCNISTLSALKNLPNKAAFVEFTSPHCEFPEESEMNLLKKSVYPRAQIAIFQTDEERDFYAYLPNTEKYVIPNPVKEGLPKRYIGNRKKEIVNFCRLDRVKNLPLLIDAFSMLVNEHPDYILSIYGEGPLKEELLHYAASVNLSDSVFFHDFDRELHSKISECAMFVSSSDREGLSNSMIEAMAIGLPTICTDCPAGGARMLIKPYENGLIVPMRDPEAMYLAMKTIIEDPILAEKMSINAVKIREELSEENICREWRMALQ